MTELFIIIISFLIILIAGISFYFFLAKQKYSSRINLLVTENNKLEKSLNELSSQLPSFAEKEQAAIEKKKMEEKNRKLWAMSETVHKERKKIEEQNETLLIEKEKLEVDKKKLDEKVKKLWAQSVSIHKEKERINELKIEIEHKHQEIIDSVNYAKRIQHALLASKQLLDKHLNDYFIFFQPKDIVSGDFYFADAISDDVFSIVTADSTGHGVPGAIMSILNISCLNDATRGNKLTLPNEIFDYTRSRVMHHMANDGSEEGGKDGMDAVICNFNFKENLLQFAAANNPLWLIRNNELIEYKPDKMPVGKPMGELAPFTLQQIELQKNDLIIMITDGFPDQFGGPKGKKFMYKNLKELLVQLSKKPLDQMKQELKSTFDEWRGKMEQVDDVLVFGVRV